MNSSCFDFIVCVCVWGGGGGGGGECSWFSKCETHYLQNLQHFNLLAS